MPEKNEIEEIVRLAQLGLEVKLPKDGKPFMIVPPGHSLQDIEKLLPHPIRKTGCPKFKRASCFCGYVNDHKTEDSRLYVCSSEQVVAVLNHHLASKERASWGDHRAELILTKTPEWILWTQHSGGRKSQRDFAQFIEDNAEDVVNPSGAALLELIRTIKSSTQVECTGEIDDSGNVKGSGFVLQTRTKSGAKGELEFPSEFVIAIAPYEGGQKISVRTRLRLEVCAPRLTLWYELVKVQQVEKQALNQIVAEIETETEIDAWFGVP